MFLPYVTVFYVSLFKIYVFNESPGRTLRLLKVHMKQNFGLSFYCLTRTTIQFREECNLLILDIFSRSRVIKGLNIRNQWDIERVWEQEFVTSYG